MALSYEEVARRLGRQAVVQIDKRRGTEFRIAPTHRGLHQDPDAIDAQPDLQVRYHGTPVVTLHPDDTYTLRTGGLATKTVLRRISEYAPVSLAVRGGTVYMQDPNTGTFNPFMEGMRVDRLGRRLEESDAGEAGMAGGPQPGLDPAMLRDLITRTIDDRMAAYGLRPRGQEPVRAVRVRTLVEPKPVEPSRSAGPAEDPVALLEHAMRANGLPEAQIQRVARDLRDAITRGRGEQPERPTLPPKKRREIEVATVPTLKCRECRQPMGDHYDGANRFRGCAWAEKHPGGKKPKS